MAPTKTTGLLTNKIRKLEKNLNEKSIRERALLLVCFLVVFFFVWRYIVFDYILASSEQISENKQQMLSQISALEGQINTMSQEIRKDPTSKLIERLKQATHDNQALLDKIQTYDLSFTEPKEMTSVLQGLLSENHNIKIIRVDSLDDKAVLEKDSSTQVYNKGILLEFQASFMDTLVFLERIEHKQVKIMWDEMTYDVTEYPIATVKIVMHTVSQEAGWLHV